jgi:hypothetical protein
MNIYSHEICTTLKSQCDLPTILPLKRSEPHAILARKGASDGSHRGAERFRTQVKRRAAGAR